MDKKEVSAKNFQGLMKVIENYILEPNLTNDYHQMLKAYNRYCEDEKNGADYIFDLRKQDDLICLIKGGLDINHLDILIRNANNKNSYYCIINGNEYKIMTDDDIIYQIRCFCWELSKTIMLYPYVEEYSTIYTYCITNNFIDIE